jgi:hypothetical protein
MKLTHTFAAAFAALAVLATTGGAFAALGVALDDTTVYEEADDDSDAVDDLFRGEFLNIVHCKGGEFCLVKSEDGKGYVAASDLALVTDDEGSDDDDEDDEDEDEDDE